MSDSSSWWAKKLAARQDPAPQPRAGLPVNMLPGYQQPPPQQPLYAQPQQQPFDPSQIRVTTENLFQAAAHWKGGQAHRIDTQPCPQCGGNQYFSRASGLSRMPPPAPHCYNCGYNGGLFDQGTPEAWGATG
jgi:hypothetical protein